MNLDEKIDRLAVLDKLIQHGCVSEAEFDSLQRLAKELANRPGRRRWIKRTSAWEKKARRQSYLVETGRRE